MSEVVRSNTREVIAEHARRLFLEQGFADTSVRQIAAAARVDPALVIRHFGSKERLFLDVIRFETDLPIPVAGSLEGLGARLLDRLVMSRPGNLEIYQLLLRASSSEGIRAALIEHFEHSFVTPLAAALGEASGAIRARLVASALFGLMVSVTLFREETLANLPPGELSRRYAPALQALIDAD